MHLKSSVLAAVAATLVLAASSASAIQIPYKKCGKYICVTRKTGAVIHGGSTDFDSIDFHQYGRNGISMNTPGPVSRVYLTNPEGDGYEQFYLKNRQISVDLNVAGVGCGYNAAFYLTAMDTTAPLGEGYCDAQEATPIKPACNEMDLVEANAGANSYAIHACNSTSGACDPWGCGFNTYQREVLDRVGPGGFIDTLSTYTVTTAFLTDTGDDHGTMNGVVQTFSQGRKSVTLPVSNHGACEGGRYWNSTGEFEAFSKSFDGGLTLIFSYWGTGPPDMDWLDGTPAVNPACNTTVGPMNAMMSNIVVRPIDKKYYDL